MAWGLWSKPCCDWLVQSILTVIRGNLCCHAHFSADPKAKTRGGPGEGGGIWWSLWDLQFGPKTTPLDCHHWDWKNKNKGGEGGARAGKIELNLLWTCWIFLSFKSNFEIDWRCHFLSCLCFSVCPGLRDLNLCSTFALPETLWKELFGGNVAPCLKVYSQITLVLRKAHKLQLRPKFPNEI